MGKRTGDRCRGLFYIRLALLNPGISYLLRPWGVIRERPIEIVAAEINNTYRRKVRILAARYIRDSSPQVRRSCEQKCEPVAARPGLDEGFEPQEHSGKQAEVNRTRLPRDRKYVRKRKQRAGEQDENNHQLTGVRLMGTLRVTNRK